MTSLTWLARLRRKCKRENIGRGDGTATRKQAFSGHHVCKTTWTLIIRERLVLVPKDNNDHDKHAVAVMTKDGCTVG